MMMVIVSVIMIVMVIVTVIVLVIAMLDVIVIVSLGHLETTPMYAQCYFVLK